MVAEALGDKRVTEFLHFLGAFLDLKYPESPFIKAVEEDPQQFALVSRAVLRRFFEVDAESHPLILTFEDLHWAPDDTIDLVHYLLSSLSDAPILVVIVARPELLARKADWARAGGERHTRVELSPLSADDAAQLMLHLLEPTGDVPDELVDAAVDMAGGSPYLLEQMVRTFHEAGTLTIEPDGKWAVHLDKLDAAELPLSVEDAISARISSLAPAERRLLEMSSTMGGVFWLGALVALSRVNEKTPELWGGHESLVAHLRDTLTGLADRDYILELPDSSIPGEVEYAFKHNLERETLHRLTNKTVLRRFHLVVAEWLEFRLAERAEEQCEMLAQHYEDGGAGRRAGHFYLLAGDKARARYANAKAAEYYSRGLELLGDEDVTLRIDALHHYGDVLQLSGRNDEALAAFRSMLDIAFKLDLKAKGGAAHNRIGRLHRAVGRLDEAMRHLGNGHALFDAAGDSRGVASSLDDVGKVHWMRGNYEAAERFMHKALELRATLGDPRSIALSQNNLGLVYQDSGRFQEAQSAFQEALVLRREIGDKPGIAQTLNNLGTIHQDNGEHDRAVELYKEALMVASEVGDRMRQAVILTNLGESEYRLEKPTEAIRVLKQAEEISATLGDRILEGEILRGLAKAHMLIHDIKLAREYVTRSVELFEEARGKPFLGVALRTQAEIYAAAGWGGGDDHKLAKDAFERSLRLFEELGNEVELAQTCESYAAFLESNPDTSSNPIVAHEAMSMRARADEIRTRLHAAEDYELPPLEGERTNPGVSLDEAEAEK
jgi:tetratricopeptide (TPR) repeat protein